MSAAAVVDSVVYPAASLSAVTLLGWAAKSLRDLLREVRHVKTEQASAAEAVGEVKRVADERFEEQKSTHDEFRSTYSSMQTRLAVIEREVRTNGGSSVKDAVLRVEETAKATKQQLDQHLIEAAYQRQRLDTFLDARAAVATTLTPRLPS